MGNNGQSAIAPVTVMKSFDNLVSRMGNLPALHQKRPTSLQKATDVPWTTWTWKEYRQQVDAFAKALFSIGFERFDAINIIGFNAPEWFFANFGAIAAGGISAGIYTTNNPDACKYVTEHSKAKVVVCEGIHQVRCYPTLPGLSLK
jgi:long-chain-fatty-acid--CoA ligase ACSBG